MKTKNIFKIVGLGLIIVPLSSCFFSLYESDYDEGSLIKKEECPIYSMVEYERALANQEKDILNINDYKKTVDSEFYYVESHHFALFTTIESFLNLSISNLKVGYRFEVKSKNNVETVTYYNAAGSEVAIAQFSAKSRMIYYAGDASAAYKSSVDTSNYSFNFRTELDSYSTLIKESVPSYSFRNLGFKVFKESGKIYYPFSLLSTFFSKANSSYNYVFNYNSIYEINRSESLNTAFTKGKEETTIKEEAKSVSALWKATVPEYLRIENRAAFSFVLETFCGIKTLRRIPSLYNYYIEAGLYEDLVSENNKVRIDAYNRAIGLLDDGHCSLSSSMVWDDTTDTYPISQRLESMVALRKILLEKRTAAYESKGLTTNDIMYSSDKKTAMISFDGFTITNIKRNIDGSVDIEDLIEKDSYFNIAYKLNRIKSENEETKNVILDISCNGGGAVATLVRLLSLISKQNISTLEMYTEKPIYVTTIRSKVDTNFDGLYDVRDVYGNTFSFYILESGYSYSCANAFPFYAKYFDYAKIIGNRSGGGECSVNETILPNLSILNHSSLNHIGVYDLSNKKFTGVEEGVYPNIRMDYKDFYDIDKMSEIINEENN